MVKGLKPTSETVIISGTIVEDAANTYKENTIDLQLDVLNQEIFVVVAADLNMSLPDADPSVRESIVRGSLSTTSRQAVGTIADTNVMAAGRNVVLSDGTNQFAGIYSDSSTETPHASLDYISLIATNDFFAQIEGTANSLVKRMDYRLWGYRARATDPAIYAALVQSELLSE